MKQAEEDRNKALDSAKRLYDEYRPIKDQLDSLRTSIGLERSPDLKDEDEHIAE